MRDRKEIAAAVNWQRNGSPFADDTNLAVNAVGLEYDIIRAIDQAVKINLESVMCNLGLAIEVLLDIREILEAKS